MIKYLLIILISLNLLNASIMDEEWEENYVNYDIDGLIVRSVVVYSKDVFTVKLNSENGAIRQSRKTTINIPIEEYDIFKDLTSVYPRNPSVVYKKLLNKLKNIKNGKIIFQENEFYNLVYENGIYDNTVQKINDLAYFYEKSSNPDLKLLIMVYKDILNLYPNRIVAYINLGDAYLGNKQKDKAIQSYKKYIELMKQSGKEKKIPKRVLELVNDSKPLTKNQSQIIPQKEEKTFFSKLLEWFGFSQFNKNINIKYS